MFFHYNIMLHQAYFANLSFRSGKSSIYKVVFHKMSPTETLFLESTSKIVKEDVTNSSFVQFSVWDFPGQIDIFDPTFNADAIFGGCGALVFVIDAQDDYLDALAKLNMTVSRAHRANPDIKCEVFIHKVDGLSDDTKMETQRDVHQKGFETSCENKNIFKKTIGVFDKRRWGTKSFDCSFAKQNICAHKRSKIVRYPID